MTALSVIVFSVGLHHLFVNFKEQIKSQTQLWFYIITLLSLACSTPMLWSGDAIFNQKELWQIMLCVNLLITSGYLICQALMFYQTNKILALSEEYEKNPGLNIQRLKNKLEVMINKVLLFSELALVGIAAATITTISLRQESF